MCDLCYCSPCREGCPNAPEPPVFAKCKVCGEPIYFDDAYYEINGRNYCEACVQECYRIAEVDYYERN